MNLDAYHRILAGDSFIFDLPDRALWRLSGPDALRYLNGQVTADIARLTDGQGSYAAVCTAKGRMEGDLFIAKHGTDFWLDAAPVLHETLGLRLEKYLIADDAVFEDLTESWSLVHVFGAALPALPSGAFAIPRERFGLPGHDIWLEKKTMLGGDRVDSDVVEILRLESAVPVWDAELTPTTLPPEAGPVLLSAISYTKGCYVGQETIARLKSVGHVNRTLVFLRGNSPAFPPPASKLLQGDREVGLTTSGGFSMRLQCGIALGYVQHTLADPGTEFRAGELKLTIVPPLSAQVK